MSDDYVHLNFSPLSMEDVEPAKASSVSGLSISLLSSPHIHQKFNICYSEALFFTLSIICFLPSFRTFLRSRRPKLGSVDSSIYSCLVSHSLKFTFCHLSLSLTHTHMHTHIYTLIYVYEMNDSTSLSNTHALTLTYVFTSIKQISKV